MLSANPTRVYRAGGRRLGHGCPAARFRRNPRVVTTPSSVMERIGVPFLSRAIGIVDALYLLALRCLVDNDRMELVGLEPTTSWVRSKTRRF